MINRRKLLVQALKLLIAAALVVWLYLKIQWNDTHVDGELRRGFLTILSTANKPLLLGALACFLMPVLILSVRWWYLLRIQRIHIPLRESVRLTFLGTFFNYIVPGTVSGDLVKAWYVAKHTHRKAAALISIFVDRVVGLVEFAILPVIVMTIMFSAGAINAQNWHDRFRTPTIVVGVVLAGAAAALSVLLIPGLRRLLRLGELAHKIKPIREHLPVAAEAAEIYRSQIGSLVKALAVTLGGQAFFITGIMLTGLSMGLVGQSEGLVPWFQFFLYVPLIYIIAAVPITPGAAGVAEAFYLLFFKAFGLADTEILAMALVSRLLPMLVSLPGLFVYLTGTKMPKAADMQAEMAEGEGAGQAAFADQQQVAEEVQGRRES